MLLLYKFISRRIASLCFVRISSLGGHNQAPGECLEGLFCKCFYYELGVRIAKMPCNAQTHVHRLVNLLTGLWLCVIYTLSIYIPEVTILD